MRERGARAGALTTRAPAHPVGQTVPMVSPPRASSPLDVALQGAARGETKAFEDLYDLCASAVYGLVRRILRDRAQSDEVLQEVMLEIWRLAPRFDPRLGTASAWIMTIAHRRAVDRVRSEVAERGRVERATAQVDVAPASVHEDVVDELDRQRIGARSNTSPTSNAPRSSWPTSVD